MANITITIPDVQIGRVITAICADKGYQDEIDGLPNPESRAQFTRRMVIEYIMRKVRLYEAREASNVAIASVNSEVTIS